MQIIGYIIISYSLLVYAIGLSGLLYKELLWATIVYYFIISIFYRKSFFKAISYLKERRNPLLSIKKLFKKITKKNFPIILLLLIILCQTMVNLIGALGPELGFDALWYHLTIPKIYLQNHAIFFIKGGLYYYNAMPRLVDLLYLGALSFSSEILAKLIHFSFGALSLIVIYKLSRLFLNTFFSILSCCIFYANLVVGWQSVTSYIDLGRTFFEVLSFYFLLLYFSKKHDRLLWTSSLLMGGAIASKLLSVGSLVIIVFLLLFYFYKQKKLKTKLKSVTFYLLFALFIPMPFFVFSFINTGNPVYPFFTQTYPVSANISLKPIDIIIHFYNLFMRSSDPISPIYIMVAPLIILYYRKFRLNELYLILYFGFAFLIWYLTPNTGGGRFIMPYLPVASVVTSIVISRSEKITRTIFICIVILLSIISIGYRGVANLRYLPVVLGQETKQNFLMNNLNFSYGDFYDVDQSIKNIVGGKNVLIYGIHNLYYADFNFIHESYVEKGHTFSYILTKDKGLPERFSYWNRIYSNRYTGVELYTFGGQKWIY